MTAAPSTMYSSGSFLNLINKATVINSRIVFGNVRRPTTVEYGSPAKDHTSTSDSTHCCGRDTIDEINDSRLFAMLLEIGRWDDCQQISWQKCRQRCHGSSCKAGPEATAGRCDEIADSARKSSERFSIKNDQTTLKEA